jgi:hypothetical protein
MRWRAAVRTAVVVAAANGLFLALVYLASGHSSLIVQRAREAFADGQLGLADYPLFDRQRGYMQYDDCNIVQMLSNKNPSRLHQALSPIVYTQHQDWIEQCAVLHALLVEGADRGQFIEYRYSRYWRGYVALVVAGLSVMDLGQLRQALLGAVWAGILLLAAVTARGRPHVRWTGAAIALSATLFWAVPFYDQGFVEGPADAFVLFGLVVFALLPRAALRADWLAPLAAGYGAGVVYLEMLTGQLPVAAAWMVALIVARRRGEGEGGGPGAWVAAAVAVTAFAFGGLLTVAIKQVLALWLTDPEAGQFFAGQLAYYTGVPDAQGGWPGLLLSFRRLAGASYLLTYGSRPAGFGLLAVTAAVWLAATGRAWLNRREPGGQEAMLLCGAALIPLAWVFVLPRHTYLHTTFMVRMLVATIALAPLALVWPRLGSRGLRSPKLPLSATIPPGEQPGASSR